MKMPMTRRASTSRNCSKSIGSPLPSASMIAGAEPSDAVFIGRSDSGGQRHAGQGQGSRVDVDAGVDLDPGLAGPLYGADEDVFGFGGWGRAAGGASIEHHLLLALFDVVDELQRFLHHSGRDPAAARRPDAFVGLPVLRLKRWPPDHAFGGIEPRPPFLAIRRSDVVKPRKIAAFVRSAVGAEMELEVRAASGQVKPMQQYGAVEQQAHGLDTDHSAAFWRLHLG